MPGIDDLTIFLRAVDRTKGVFDKVDNRMRAVEKAAKVGSLAFKGLQVAAVGAFTAAANNGRVLTNELQSMARQTNLSLQEAQALFNAVREADRSANLDNLNEALLSVKERFADARVGAGPLKGLLDDFNGFELDLGVDNARDQLANFLEQVAMLPDANAKIFALKEVLGDKDARPFFNVINNTEKLNKLLVDLRTNVEDLPNIITAEQQANIEAAARSSKILNEEWDRFSLNVFGLASGPLSALNDALTGTLRAVNQVLVASGATNTNLTETTSRIASLTELVLQFADGVRLVIDGIKLLVTGFVGSFFAINEQLIGMLDTVVSRLPFVGEKWSETTAQMLADARAFRVGAEMQVSDLFGNVSGILSGKRSLAAQFRAEYEIAQADAAVAGANVSVALATGIESDAALGKSAQKQFEKITDQISNLKIPDNLLSLSELQLFEFDEIRTREIGESIRKLIMSADIPEAVQMRLLSTLDERIATLQRQIDILQETAVVSGEEAFIQDQADIYGAQIDRSPLEVGDALAETQERLAEAAKAAASVTRQAWQSAAGTLGQVFDALKSDVGSFIKINESMSESDKKLAQQTNSLNRQRFEENKKWSRAQVALSAAVGISRALEQPFPLSLAAAAQVAVTAFAQLAAINRTTFGSPATTPVGGAGASTGNNPQSAIGGTAQTAQTAPRSLNITIEGEDDTPTSRAIEKIVEGMIDNGYIDDGRVIRI